MIRRLIQNGNGKDAAAYHSDVHDAEDASEDGERQGDERSPPLGNVRLEGGGPSSCNLPTCLLL